MGVGVFEERGVEGFSECEFGLWFVIYGGGVGEWSR